MGQPAARINDMHNCPMQTPATPNPIPHVGGPIQPPGNPQVLIGGEPAACLGDMLMCEPPAPPDSIVKGSATVFIGNKPAARQGDATSHGGSIAMGSPLVLIG